MLPMQTRVLLLLSILWTTFVAADTTTVPFPERIESQDFRGYLAKSDGFYIAGQPTAKDLDWIKAQGVQAVVNLRTPKEMAEQVPFDEEAKVTALGLKYEAIPLGAGKYPYTPAELEKFAQVMEQHQGKVLLHCTVAWRASHMWAAYLVKYRGFSEQEAIDHAAAVHFMPGHGREPFDGLLGH